MHVIFTWPTWVTFWFPLFNFFFKVANYVIQFNRNHIPDLRAFLGDALFTIKYVVNLWSKF